MVRINTYIYHKLIYYPHSCSCYNCCSEYIENVVSLWVAFCRVGNREYELHTQRTSSTRLSVSQPGDLLTILMCGLFGMWSDFLVSWIQWLNWLRMLALQRSLLRVERFDLGMADREWISGYLILCTIIISVVSYLEALSFSMVALLDFIPIHNHSHEISPLAQQHMNLQYPAISPAPSDLYWTFWKGSFRGSVIYL